MKKTYTKQEFDLLPFDDQCSIIEELMHEEYMIAQSKADFWSPPTDVLINSKKWPKPPPGVAEEDEMKLKMIVHDLSNKLFLDKKTIIYNSDF